MYCRSTLAIRGRLGFKLGYPADVKKVMIASPGDVYQERRVIRDVVDEWNTIHAEDRHVVLMPVGQGNPFLASDGRSATSDHQ